jgi:hypothetical protein
VDIRFLVDEHLRGQLWQALMWHNQRGVYPLDMERVGDSADLPLGSTDPDILIWAEREGRILVSGDRKTLVGYFADHLSASRHSPGVFLLRPSSSLPQIVDFLVAVTYASEASEWADVWRYVP